MTVTSFAMGASLFFVLIVFISLNSENEWSKLKARLAIQSEIIANNSVSAIIFDDSVAAEEILVALKADDSIMSAKISTRSSKVFASFDNPLINTDVQINGMSIPLDKWASMHFFSEHAIYYQGNEIGTVQITGSLSQFYRNNLQYVLIALMVSLVAMLLTMILSNILLKRIVEPILKLNSTAKKITHLSSYAVRAEVLSKDEIGDLTHSFNEMLDEIQRKDRVLEHTVAERTSELIQLNQKLKHQATHDALTGLANRLLFNDRLQQVVKHARRMGNKVALLYFDLDHFKMINDTLGHDTGDELLIAVTQRMKALVRENDTLCRIGGDEFTLILSAIESSSDSERVAQKMLTVFAQPFFCNQHELSISSSIGISLYPEHTQSAEKLNQFADIAMYHSKRVGRNNYCFFMPEMYKENAQMMDYRVLLKRQLKSAIDNNELQVYYQPQVNMQRKIIAVEALLRWQNAENKMISPDVFVPLAEEAGLIQGLEEWVFTEVCHDYANWRNEGLADIKISLNISGYRLRQQHFNQFIEHTLQTLGLAADFLIFEIAEKDIMQNIQETEKVLNQLNRKGIKIAIDNFGASFTSLNYLQLLSVDQFKIDAQFIWQLVVNDEPGPVVQAIIGLAEGLNKAVVAMGVEQEAQANYLAGLNCQAMQGYLFSKPVTEADVRTLLINNVRLTASK